MMPTATKKIALGLAALVFVGALSVLTPSFAGAVSALDSVLRCSNPDPSHACVVGVNTGAGYGVAGESDVNNGVKGHIRKGGGSPGSLLAGVAGVDTSRSGFTNGVSGESLTGNGGYFKTHHGLNALIAENDNFDFHVEGHSTVLVMGPNNSVPEVLLFSRGSTSGFPLADVDDANGEVFYFTNTGDLHLKGKVFTGGDCSTGCLPVSNAAGHQLTSYTPRQPLPTLEDFGEARIVNGEARVDLDPAFAATIDARQPYLVFLTPDGPNKGLYVSEKSRRAFAVRESFGGRSTLTFDYRIVAKPIDTTASERFASPVAGRPEVQPSIPSVDRSYAASTRK